MNISFIEAVLRSWRQKISIRNNEVHYIGSETYVNPIYPPRMPRLKTYSLTRASITYAYAWMIDMLEVASVKYLSSIRPPFVARTFQRRERLARYSLVVNLRNLHHPLPSMLTIQQNLSADILHTYIFNPLPPYNRAISTPSTPMGHFEVKQILGYF